MKRKVIEYFKRTFEGSENASRSGAYWLALFHFDVRYLGWRSSSLGLVELTLGYYMQRLRRKEIVLGMIGLRIWK